MKYTVSGFLAAMLIPSTVWAVTPPYQETFDAEATCAGTCGVACPLTNGWVNVGGDNMDWTAYSGSTSSAATGPTGDHTSGSGKYLYTESSGTCTLSQALLVSPDFDLTMGNATQFEFWYHMYGASQGTLHVDVDPDGGGDGPWTMDIIPAFTDNINQWQLMIVDLTPYVGTTINVRLRGVTGTSFESDMAIDDARLYNLWPDDIMAQSIDSPLGGCSLTASETVSVTVANLGSNPQTSFDVSYTVNGGPAVVETYTGNLAPLSTDTFTFVTPVDLSGAGPYTIDAWVSLPADQDPANDAAPPRTIVPLGDKISVFPHINDFESGPGDWYSYGANNTWALGTPAKTIIMGAASGINAWVNGGLTGSYLNNDQSYVETQCGYDFSNVMYPAVRFNAWWATEYSYDRAYLQASVDDGQTWQTVGAYQDPINWYNITGGGWTGDSNGYLTVAHELQAYAGLPFVKFRIWFHSDGSVIDNGFAFDDFEIFDNLPRLDVADASPPVPVSSIAPGSSNVVAQSLRFNVFGNLSVDIDAVTVTLTGSLPPTDIVAVKLWLDNNDTVFDAATDVLVASGTYAGNTVTFSGLGADISLPSLEPRWLHITYDLAPTATPGASFGSSIASENDIVPLTMVPIVFSNTPLDGPLLSVLELASFLPWVEDFDGMPMSNRTTRVEDGVYYPTAGAAGPVVDISPSPSPNVGYAQITDQVDDGVGGFITPLSPPYMGALSFPNGGAAAALEYWFDLSAYNVNDDLFWLEFSWNNANLPDHDLTNVFISTDATTSWAASLYRFDFSTPVAPGWHDEAVDISTALLAAGTDYSATTVLRFQAFGSQDFGGDGLTIDNLWIGIPQYAKVERVIGNALPSGTIDGVNGMGTGAITLTYTLTNDSHRILTLGDITASALSGVTGLTVTPTTLPTPMNPGDSTSFDVSFNADIAQYTFLLEFPTDDPRVMGGMYTLTVQGDHGPKMDIERETGISIPTGSTDQLGLVTDNEQFLRYTIVNNGTLDLSLTGMPDLVTISNPLNVATAVSLQPMESTLPVGGSVTFDVTLTPDTDADFQFDIVIESDDTNQNPYTITVSGTTMLDTPDAGPVEVDAGPDSPDAGTTPPPDDEGCSCTVGEAPPSRSPVGYFILMALFAGLYFRRRPFAGPREDRH